MKKIILLFAFLAATAIQVHGQWNYGSPFSTSPPSPTWHQVVNRPPFNEMFDSLTFPYPTNAWFNNFFLGQLPYPQPFGILGANKIHPYPYQLGLGFGYGAYPNYRGLLAINYKPYNWDTVTAPSGVPVVTWNGGDFVYMGTQDTVARFRPTLLNDYSELSVTIRFTDSTNSSRYYYAPIVRGMPYVTMFYNNIRPGVFFPGYPILQVNDTNVTAGMNFTNRVFKIQTGGVPNTINRPQTWLLFSSVPITLQFSTHPKTMGLIALANFTGWLRLAHVTYQGENVTSQQIQEKIDLLTAYAKFIPIKGQVSASYSGGPAASMQYTFTRYNEGQLTGDSLLMMALPHHVDMLSNSTTDVLKYTVLKGMMKEVRQKVWNMTENMMPEYGFYPRYGTLAGVPLQWCDTLLRYVNNDFNTWYSSRTWMAPDVYFGAKAFQRLARVAVIADELYERDSSRYAAMLPLAQRMRDTLKLHLGNYLQGRHTLNPIHGPGAWDSLSYDTKFGGLISTLSWDSLNIGSGFAYGSALYNDHHFHYGYILYTAAAVAKKEPGWFTANGNYYFNRVVDLIREISNPSRNDGHFGLSRYRDWFEGHSWANGMVPYGAGKNQESTSEAQNAWYGMYLFGLAMGNDNIRNTGALNLAQEIRATRKYYQIRLPMTNPVYPPFFTNTLHIVTNMYSIALDGQTFFGTEPYTVFGIHAIPTTPVVEQVWDAAYARDVFDYTPYGLRYSASFDSTNTNNTAWNWTTICVGIQAVAYPLQAWNFFRFYGYDNNKYDNGTTSANVVYWILTRLYNTIGIEPLGSEVPERFALGQNYPNPFNPKTSINFHIPKKSFVELKLYDILGREAGTLIEKEMDPGSYKYEFDGSKLASGVYFYVMRAGGFMDSKKMILVK
jgi:endo-1,3(4)-beta-glucanase